VSLVAFSLGIKRQGREADHSPSTTAEVKKGGATPPLPHMSSWQSAQPFKHPSNFIFTIYAKQD
jgi:hypothetical protein